MTVFWKTRWETSIDGSNTPYRTLVCYKETHANAKIDPLPNVWTGTWRDPRFSPPADGGRPENALMGNIFMVNGRANNRHRSTCQLRAAALLAKHTDREPRARSDGRARDVTPGYEWDEDLDNGFRPEVSFRCRRRRKSITSSFSTTVQRTEQGRRRIASRSTGRRPAHSSSVPERFNGRGDSTVPTMDGASTPDIAHAAGDRQPVRGHGGTTGQPDVWIDRRDRVQRHDGSDVDHHITGLGRCGRPRRTADDQRHRDGRRRRRRRRRRSFRGWRNVASRDRAPVPGHIPGHQVSSARWR